jgi:hypothetical protein
MKSPTRGNATMKRMPMREQTASERNSPKKKMQKTGKSTFTVPQFSYASPPQSKKQPVFIAIQKYSNDARVPNIGLLSAKEQHESIRTPAFRIAENNQACHVGAATQGSPTFVSLHNATAVSSSNKNNGPTIAAAIAGSKCHNAKRLSLEPVKPKVPKVHDFWSPSPKRSTYTYLITGGVSEFLRRSIANVEDLVDFSNNKDLYFKDNSSLFDRAKPEPSTSVNNPENEFVVRSCARWNRFTWKVEAASPGIGEILLLSVDQTRRVAIAEGSRIRLGSVYCHKPKTYLDWTVAA